MKKFSKYIKKYDEEKTLLGDIFTKNKNKTSTEKQTKSKDIMPFFNKMETKNKEKKSNDSVINKFIEKTQSMISGIEKNDSQTPKIAKNLIKNTYGRFNEKIAKNIKNITNPNETKKDKIFSIAQNNFKNFYNYFAENMKKIIIQKNFSFSSDQEGEICTNIIESYGDLNKYIKKQYPKINIFFANEQNEKFKILNMIDNDIKNKIRVMSIDKKKFTILKNIKQ